MLVERRGIEEGWLCHGDWCRFAAGYRDSAVGVRARHAVWKVQVKPFGGKGATVRRGVGGRGVDGYNRERTRLVER